jgi:hypothetical protein
MAKILTAKDFRKNSDLTTRACQSSSISTLLLKIVAAAFAGYSAATLASADTFRRATANFFSGLKILLQA